jgi:hypothetical protein
MQFDDDLDQALQVDVLANMLKSDRQASADLVEVLASMLEGSLPDKAKIVRGGWFMSKNRPVEELSIQFDETGYQITKNKHGAVSVKQQKIVRGVALKSSEVSMEQCMTDIVAQLTALAKKDSATRAALNKFMRG